MRRVLIVLTFLALAPLTAVRAETVAETVTRQLQAQGYTSVDSSYTWLGRLRIFARQGDLRREIVINPNTGEILRDLEQVVPRYASDQPRERSDTAGQTTLGVTADGRDIGGAVSVPEIMDPGTTVADGPIDTGVGE